MCTDFGLIGCQFIDHMVHAFGFGAPLDWLHDTIPKMARSAWTYDQFKKAFLANYTGQVRDPGCVALDQLLDNTILQGTDTTQSYATRFLAVARLAPSIQGSALCKCFINGLSPALKPRCVLTLQNETWTDISALMAHTHSEALRLQLVASISSPTPTLPSPLPYSTPSTHSPPNLLSLPNPNNRWNKTQRLAVMRSILQATRDDMIDDTEGGPSTAPQLNHQAPPYLSALTSAPLALPVIPVNRGPLPPTPYKPTSSKRPFVALNNGNGSSSDATPTIPFVSTTPAHSGQLAMVSDDLGHPLFFNPPDMTHAQLIAVPGWNTIGKLNTLDAARGQEPGWHSAQLRNAGICTRCRCARHPTAWCEVLDSKKKNRGP